MNDELEKLILSNRNSLQNEEPLDGHFERFEARLQNRVKPKSQIQFRLILKIAAVVVFALLLVNQVRIHFYSEKKEDLTLGSISPEYREVEFYYTNAIQLGIKQWEGLKNEGLVSETEHEMMQKEQEDFDQMFQKLQNDLKANPTDERVINAMLEYYQARMNIMKMIISKLQEIKQQKYQKDEIKI
jgi:hypothetical protein